MKHPDATFFDAIAPHRRVLVCIKGSPDPDALAAGFVCKLLCEKVGKKCRVVATQKLALHQNRVFVKRLSLPLEVVDSFEKVAGWADAYVVVDHASPVVDGLSEKLPCVVHVDHHEPVRAPLDVTMRWCRTDVGATSTLIAQVLQARHEGLKFSRRDMRRMATALLFGIQTDTDQYALAAEADYAAIRFLSRFGDAGVLKRLSGVPLGRTTMHRLKVAERNQTVYKDWLITGVRFVPHKSRDDIAIIADLLLRREKVSLVVVFALVEDERRDKLTLDASVRTKDPQLKLNHLIRRIATDGGGRKFKGAFQARLDYFQSYSGRDELWTLVERATVEKLKRARDARYKVRLQGMFDRAGEAAAEAVSGAGGRFWGRMPQSIRQRVPDDVWQRVPDVLQRVPDGVRGALLSLRERVR